MDISNILDPYEANQVLESDYEMALIAASDAAERVGHEVLMNSLGVCVGAFLLVVVISVFVAVRRTVKA